MNMLAEMSTNLKNKITEKKHFYHEQTRCNIRADIDIRREEIEFSNQTSLRENLNSQLEQLESKVNTSTYFSPICFFRIHITQFIRYLTVKADIWI